MNIEKPQARSLLLCDNLVVEEGTRNVSLTNCFTQKVFDQFPATPLNCVAFAALSNGFGQFPITLRIQLLDQLELIYEHASNVMFLDRLAEVRYYLRIRDLRFPKPGSYGFSLLLDGEVLADTRIDVRKREG